MHCHTQFSPSYLEMEFRSSYFLQTFYLVISLYLNPQYCNKQTNSDSKLVRHSGHFLFLPTTVGHVLVLFSMSFITLGTSYSICGMTSLFHVEKLKLSQA